MVRKTWSLEPSVVKCLTEKRIMMMDWLYVGEGDWQSLSVGSVGPYEASFVIEGEILLSILGQSPFKNILFD